MVSTLQVPSKGLRHLLRDRIAQSLGISEARKVDLYADLSDSAILADGLYWLQVLFAAGIASLGLTTNSPAVIIGAMLISPLMGPILSCGLSLASGDLILGIRTVLKLGLSCIVAVAFAFLLTWILPFKEITAEIASRTHPNTIDLAIALFSGAIGSLATCRDVKGIATSIPGVAIAVALMPPLCVVGYGLGVEVSVGGGSGWAISKGGGLLFLTNLVAITFTAMVVFLALHIATPAVREHALDARADDPESIKVQLLIDRIPGINALQRVNTVVGRLLAIGVVLALLMIPLSTSFTEMKTEILATQRDNQIRQTARTVWQSRFARSADGSPRSYIGSVSVGEDDGKIDLLMNVFTNAPYTDREQAEYKSAVAEALKMAPGTVTLSLVEVPTASSNLFARAAQNQTVPSAPTVGELRERFVAGVSAAMEGLELPDAAALVTYSVETGPDGTVRVRVVYLCDREISPDAASLITQSIRERLSNQAAVVTLELVQTPVTLNGFARNQSTIVPADEAGLARIVEALSTYPEIHATITGGSDPGEREGVSNERATAVKSYIGTTGKIDASRLVVATQTGTGRSVVVQLTRPGGSRGSASAGASD